MLLLTRGGTSSRRRSRRARCSAALLLIVGPWLWQLARERDAERTARIRTDERAEVAARVHDSVLQTLALIQRHADEPRRVASLARAPGARAARLALRQRRRRRATSLAGALARRGGRDRGAARRARRARERRRLPAHRRACARSCSRRARRWRTRPSSPAPTRSPSTPRPTTSASASSSATAAPASTARRSRDDRRGLAESIEGRMARAGGTRDDRLVARRGHRGRADLAARSDA